MIKKPDHKSGFLITRLPISRVLSSTIIYLDPSLLADSSGYRNLWRTANSLFKKSKLEVTTLQPTGFTSLTRRRARL